MESQNEILKRVLAEALEARQHPCKHCGHAGDQHAFDIYPIDKTSKTCPCAISCRVCFDIQTKELKEAKS